MNCTLFAACIKLLGIKYTFYGSDGDLISMVSVWMLTRSIAKCIILMVVVAF